MGTTSREKMQEGAKRNAENILQQGTEFTFRRYGKTIKVQIRMQDNVSVAFEESWRNNRGKTVTRRCFTTWKTLLETRLKHWDSIAEYSTAQSTAPVLLPR